MGYVPLKKIFPFTLTKKEEKFERKNPYLLETLSPLSPSVDWMQLFTQRNDGLNLNTLPIVKYLFN